MDFYLSFNNLEQQLRLPVTPSEFELRQAHNNTVVNITNLGELNLIGKKGLASMTVSSFFPSKDYHFCKYQGFPKPYECVKLIQGWKDSGKPIRVIVTNTPINYAMAIDSFVFGEKDGTGDVYFTLELKEYVFVKASKTEKVTPSGTELKIPQTKRESKSIPSTYTVKSGDTLYAISKRLTGNMSNAKAIAQKNGIKDMNKIYVGQKLVI